MRTIIVSLHHGKRQQIAGACSVLSSDRLEPQAGLSMHNNADATALIRASRMTGLERKADRGLCPAWPVYGIMVRMLERYNSCQMHRSTLTSSSAGHYRSRISYRPTIRNGDESEY